MKATSEEALYPRASLLKKKRLSNGKIMQKLRRNIGKAIEDYQMICNKDRVMVCLSGGKDSFTLLKLLTELQIKAPVRFEIIAFHLDQGQPGYPKEKMELYLRETKIDYLIESQDTYSIVSNKIEKGKTLCGLCSRLRRGIIYRVAKEVGATKIALGHHLDDIIETLFLNMFFGSKLKAMPPKLLSDDGDNVIIRPLSYCLEKDILNYSDQEKFPIIPCNLCGSQENLQRKVVKKMLNEWERDYPGRKMNIFRSISSVVPSHLADNELFDFSQIRHEEIVNSSLPLTGWYHQK
jgi:tRNA 2-thiocytidine biosynthesis protein TtcA